MGVLGLTTFIANDIEKYLKPTVLKDCTLVIDGNCIASHLFKWRTKRDSAFGGDYDEYWLIVQTFFKHLKKCRITPIVVMDGGYEQRKLPTVYLRLKTKIMTLKTTLNVGFSDIKFFPLFMHQVFCEAVKSLKVQLIQCEFEADGEIAALARRLNCPVLSLDSDFFIYDVLYVPFSSLDSEPVEEDGSLVFRCSMYDVDAFLGLFPGLNKKHLPLVAVLLGNDFNDHSIFDNFFLHVPLRDFKRKTVVETRILGLLNWLSNQTEEGAIAKVNEFLDGNEKRMFENAVVEARANYSYSGKCAVDVAADGKVTVHPPVFDTPFHPHVQKLLTSLNLPPFLITLASMRSYLPTLLVENISAPSCHLTSLELIDVIDRLLCSHTGDTSAPHIHLRQRTALADFYGARHSCEDEVTHDALMNAPLETRRDFLQALLVFDAGDKKIIASVIPESQLFLSAFMHWCMTKKLTPSHIHALLACYIACQAKSRVGYFRVGKDSTLNPNEVSAFVSLLAPYRKTAKSTESYSTENVHEFSRFQSLLYYASVLNAMLGYPFMACKIAESFAGTVVYNFFAKENRHEFYETFQEFLKTAPGIQEIYTTLLNLLSRYVPNRKGEKKKKKKKTKAKPVKVVAKSNVKNVKRKNSQDDEEEDVDGVDDVDYNDLGNKFNCLRTGDDD